ncbi:macB-like periplasmic core domain-containing protein [Ditylenchus destructor]|nr:macB-like periplasmic core domain-containing protein [Ditylenchus destructor]
MAQAEADKGAAVSAGAKTARPFSAFERMVAWRYLRSRRKEAFISVIAGFSFVGIMLGVATLIIVMAVMNGFRTELISRILGINGHMIVQPIDQPFNNYDELAKKFAAVPGVTMALPLVEGQTLASGRGGAGSGALVRGVRQEDIDKVKEVATNIKTGDLVGFMAGDGVLVGSRLAAQLGVTAGDDITLISPEGDVTPMGVNPRVKSYKISGVFEIGMSEYDASMIYMPLSEAQLYFNADGIVQSIELYVSRPDDVDGIRPLVEQAVERNVMFMILTLIVLVAALNIISGLIMLVKDKGSDIAILRTMGASSGAVMRIFFMTGAAIGMVGTFAGVALGLYFLSQLPAEMDISETISVVIMALTLSFLATIFPAWRASKLDPVQALRYE